MLREIGDLTGLTSQVSDVLADTYKGQWVHDRGVGDLLAGAGLLVQG